MSEAFLHISDDNFDSSVLKSATPILLEFGATWCQPCKRLEPLLEKLAQQWAGKVTIAKMDVDESVNTTMRFQVMSVPTVILFVNGQPVQRLTGLQPLDKLVEKFESHL